jgi:hypothetical protein
MLAFPFITFRLMSGTLQVYLCTLIPPHPDFLKTQPLPFPNLAVQINTFTPGSRAAPFPNLAVQIYKFTPGSRAAQFPKIAGHI